MNMGILIAIKGIDTARAEVDRLTKEIQEWIKTDAPLEDRWSAYLAIEPYLSHSGCCFDLDSASEDMGCGELTYYDDLDMERYQVDNLSTIMERLQDNVLEDVPEYDIEVKAKAKELGVDYIWRLDDSITVPFLRECRLKHGCKFEKFRNKIMASGYGESKNDW